MRPINIQDMKDLSKRNHQFTLNMDSIRWTQDDLAYYSVKSQGIIDRNKSEEEKKKDKCKTIIELVDITEGDHRIYEDEDLYFWTCEIKDFLKRKISFKRYKPDRIAGIYFLEIPDNNLIEHSYIKIKRYLNTISR